MTHVFAGIDVAIVIDCAVCARRIYSSSISEADAENIQAVADEAKQVAQVHMREHDVPYWQQDEPGGDA